MNRIVGYCIVDTEKNERWGALYESQAGAKSSFNIWVKQRNYYRDSGQAKFNAQTRYVIKPVWLLDDSI